MARVNVEESAFTTDAHKFRRMSHLLRVTEYDVYGRWLFVWRLAQSKRSAILTAGEIDGAANLPGFAAAAVDAGLGREEPDGVYLSGTKRRLAELESYYARTANARAVHKGKRNDGDNSPCAQSPAQINAQSCAQPSPLVLESKKTPPYPPPGEGKSDPDDGDAGRAMGLFADLFRRRYSKPYRAAHLDRRRMGERLVEAGGWGEVKPLMERVFALSDDGLRALVGKSPGFGTVPLLDVGFFLRHLNAISVADNPSVQGTNPEHWAKVMRRYGGGEE